MKERPILFSGPMVRAILEGRKTQTRQMVKPQPDWRNPVVGVDGVAIGLGGSGPELGVSCPYGQPGDRLWVKEHHARIIGADGIWWGAVHYLADGPMPSIEQRHDAGLLRSHPSIHMPRWASRITLEITGVRVERLQDISPNDCRAEGMPEKNNDIGVRYAFGQLWESIHRRPQLPPNPRSRRYGRVKRWLDKHPDQSWEANPWVWVIEFRRLEGLR